MGGKCATTCYNYQEREVMQKVGELKLEKIATSKEVQLRMMRAVLKIQAIYRGHRVRKRFSVRKMLKKR